MSFNEIDVRVIPGMQLEKSISKSSFFFHSPSFVNRLEPQNLFACLILSQNKTLGQMAFTVENSGATSLPLSPFGGFDLDPAITEEQLIKALSLFANYLKSIEVEKLTIRLYPECYNPELYNLQADCFSALGFKIIYADQSQYLIIHQQKSLRSFVHDSQYRHLNFGKRNENQFFQLDINALGEVYQLLKNNREDQGYPMTMEMDQLKFAMEKFPDRYFLFGFFIDGQLAASSICIHVNDDILYDFYHGHHRNYSKHSPVIPLVNGIYSYAQEKSYRLLDFGISTVKGIRNTGLYRFKERIGGQPSIKATFEINLDRY